LATHTLTQAREERAGCEARAESATARLNELSARIRDELFEVKAKAGRQESRGSLAGLHGR